MSASQGWKALARGCCTWKMLVHFLPQPHAPTFAQHYHFITSSGGKSREDISPPHMPWERSYQNSSESEMRRLGLGARAKAASLASAALPSAQAAQASEDAACWWPYAAVDFAGGSIQRLETSFPLLMGSVRLGEAQGCKE